MREGLMSDCKQYAMSASSVIETSGRKAARCFHIVALDGAINSNFIKDIALHFDGSYKSEGRKNIERCWILSFIWRNLRNVRTLLLEDLN
ncbi:MAG: hypothetical protein ACTS6G_00625 [Candidatus Hodgkinia cicadicola]